MDLIHAALFILKASFEVGVINSPFMNNYGRIRKVKNMTSHPAGNPLSQELDPQTGVVNVNAALRSSNVATPGWPVSLGRTEVFGGAVITAHVYCALPCEQQGWDLVEILEFESSCNKLHSLNVSCGQTHLL